MESYPLWSYYCLIVFLVVLLASIIQGMTGFGGGLLIGPALTLFLEPKLVVIIIMFTGVGNLVFVEAELDRSPRALVRTVEYPYRARQRNIEGEVRVKLLVRRNGTIGQVQILAAEPAGYFEDAVRRAAPGWRFEPGQIAGEPVDAWVVTTVSFQMNPR